MNGSTINLIISFLLAVIVYPGLLVAAIAAWALGWVRSSTQAALQGGSQPGPLREVGALRALFGRETYQPEEVQPWAYLMATTLAILTPLVALILLPLPGNPLVSAFGLRGDLAAEGALLLGVPLTRLLIGWATPSPYTRLAADRGARLLAGAALPFALALTAAIQVAGTLEPLTAPIATSQKYFVAGALALGAIAFACALPVLARTTPIHQDEGEAELSGGEVSELSGRDLACFRAGEALQLVAASAIFVVVFILPLIRLFSPNLPLLTQGIIFVVALLLTAAGVGAWDGFHTRVRTGEDRPPLTWWLGLPLLLALGALVAAAWATRGV